VNRGGKGPCCAELPEKRLANHTECHVS
jgi:hypothetical protein